MGSIGLTEFPVRGGVGCPRHLDFRVLFLFIFTLFLFVHKAHCLIIYKVNAITDFD